MITRRNFNKNDLIYMAGFFDGEGCVAISKINLKNPEYKSPRYVLEVTAYNCDKDVMDWILTKFGGSTQLRVKPKEKWYWKDNYGWKITSNKAIPFLKELLPYLKVKKKQAELAIEFQEQVMNVKNRKTIPVKAGNGISHRLAPSEINKRDKYWRQMIKLNNRGLKTRRD